MKQRPPRGVLCAVLALIVFPQVGTNLRDVPVVARGAMLCTDRVFEPLEGSDMRTISSAQPGVLCLLAIGMYSQAHLAAAQPSVYPTGVSLYSPKLAYNCYLLFEAPDNRTHLIDMDGGPTRASQSAGD